MRFPRFLIAAVLVGFLPGKASEAQEPPLLPLVFKSNGDLKTTGLSLSSEDGHSNRCYYYGDGGWTLSVSDDLLAHYKERGFSRRSLCMGLASGILYNPENGERLTTYVMIFEEETLEAAETEEEQEQLEPGVTSDELPLSLPDCFKNGLPYTDCQINYDMKSGKKLGSAKTSAYKEMGEAVENELKKPSLRDNFKYIDDGDEEFSLPPGTIGVGGIQLDMSQAEARLGVAAHTFFYDYSDDFQKGFGYALYADGASAPAVTSSVIKAARDRRKRAGQVNAARLAELLRRGR